MGVFFRFTENCEVLVARIPFANKVSDEVFEKRAKKIPLEKFMEKFEDEREQLLKELALIKKMNFRNITVLGPVIQFLDGEGYYESGCIIDGKYFPRFHQDFSVRDEAISYGYKRYGKAFMDRIVSKKYLEYPSRARIEILERRRGGIFFPEDALVYLHGEKEISKQEYDQLMELRKTVTSVRNVDSLLQVNKTKKIK